MTCYKYQSILFLFRWLYFQAVVNSLEGDIHQLKDNLLHQKKRSTEIMVSLLKDLNEIGTMFANDMDIKVLPYFLNV